MALTRRFMFHGSAVALGGHLYSPNDIVIEVEGASALPSTGGRSRAAIKGRDFGGLVKFTSASTDAEGQFDDPAQAIDAITGKVADEKLTTTTTVAAELKGLSVGSQPVLTVGRIAAKFVTRNAIKSNEPSITLTKDTAIEGAAIDGYSFSVDVNLEAFEAYDTYSKLKSGSAKGKPPLFDAGGAFYSTVVKAITWTGAPHPDATIDQNSISVRGFGRVVFGGILIGRASRRLTMIRVDLGFTGPGGGRPGGGPPGGGGNPGGGGRNGVGRLTGVELDPNGLFWPPIDGGPFRRHPIG